MNPRPSFVVLLVFALCLLVMDESGAMPLLKHQDVDGGAMVFMRCMQQVEQDVALHIKPEMDSMEVWNLCLEKTACIAQRVRSFSKAIVSPTDSQLVVEACDEAD